MKFYRRIAWGVLSLVAVTAPMTGVLASGTIGGGGVTQSGARLGQSVYAHKIACGSCMFPGGLKSADSVTMALAKIEGGQIALSAEERTALTSYINRRFKGQ